MTEYSQRIAIVILLVMAPMAFTLSAYAAKRSVSPEIQRFSDLIFTGSFSWSLSRPTNG